MKALFLVCSVLVACGGTVTGGADEGSGGDSATPQGEAGEPTCELQKCKAGIECPPLCVREKKWR